MGNMDNPFVVDDEAFSCEAEFYACYPNYKFPEEIAEEICSKYSEYKLDKIFREHYLNSIGSTKGKSGRLNNCNLEDICFSIKELGSFEFEKCNLRETFFDTCNLSWATFDLCNIQDSSFQECMLQMTDFSSSDLRHCRFYDCNLYKAMLEGCDISQTKFICCLGDGVYVKTFFTDSEIVNYTSEKIFMVDDVEFEISDLYDKTTEEIATEQCLFHKHNIKPFAEWFDKQREVFKFQIETNPAEPTLQGRKGAQA